MLYPFRIIKWKNCWTRKRYKKVHFTAVSLFISSHSLPLRQTQVQLDIDIQAAFFTWNICLILCIHVIRIRRKAAIQVRYAICAFTSMLKPRFLRGEIAAKRTKINSTGIARWCTGKMIEIYMRRKPYSHRFDFSSLLPFSFLFLRFSFNFIFVK